VRSYPSLDTQGKDKAIKSLILYFAEIRDVSIKGSEVYKMALFWHDKFNGFMINTLNSIQTFLALQGTVKIKDNIIYRAYVTSQILYFLRNFFDNVQSLNEIKDISKLSVVSNIRGYFNPSSEYLQCESQLELVLRQVAKQGIIMIANILISELLKYHEITNVACGIFASAVSLYKISPRLKSKL